MKADFFISIHHNSLAESSQANSVSGTEVYYHKDSSAELAANLLKYVPLSTRRNSRGAFQSYYRVTRMTYAPSVLLELGYLPNPREYEEVIDPFMLYRSSCASLSRCLRRCGNPSPPSVKKSVSPSVCGKRLF
jgi:N-acetylmuramoyl-L-alanine amidase